MENFGLFAKGVKDSLCIPTSIIQIMSSYKLSKKTFLCMLVNGLIYLGSVIFYNFFMINLFNDDTGSSSTNHWFLLVIKTIMSIFYNFWILVIYIIALTLNTFWVQDIFNDLL